jgi:hypothetical protein
MTILSGGDLVYALDGYLIHVFLTSGTITVVEAGDAEVLAVGGGGGSGHAASNASSGGGGGGEVATDSVTFSVNQAVTIGAGGPGGTTGNNGTNGGSTIIGSLLTAIGGGGGGRGIGTAVSIDGSAGASGGGAGGSNTSPTSTVGGNGTAGNDGGNGHLNGTTANRASGGGGGAGAVGGNAASAAPGLGGDGITNDYSGTSTFYGGGGGGTRPAVGGGVAGGQGGGGAGVGDGIGTPGAANTGGGGGGSATAGTARAGAAGGSGIAIIRYPVVARGELLLEGYAEGVATSPPAVPPVLVNGAVRQAIANAPLIQVEGDAVHPLRARILRLPDLSLVAALTTSRADRAREQRNAPGSGEFQLLLDDPVAALVRKYDLIQHIIEGQVAFTTLVEDIDEQTVAMEEEAGEGLFLRGRGHLALLELGLVYPTRGPGAQPIERDRVWNWTTPVYDDSFWPVSTDVGPATGVVRTPLLQAGYPSVGFSIPGATWRGSTDDTQYHAPPGSVYYRSPPITVPTTREYIAIWAADNFGELYAGGQQIDTLARSRGRANYLEGHAVPITISSGTPIVFAARVVNVGGGALPGPTPNPVGFYFALVTHDQDGNVDSVIEVADGDWLALGRPASEPGMTPGEVARLTLEEWAARAAAAGQDIPPIALTCTDDVDSLGQPWSETPNIATKVGNDILTFFTEIAATYWEMRMRPASLDLDLYVHGTHPPSGVTYAPAPANDPLSGNIQSLRTRNA